MPRLKLEEFIALSVSPERWHGLSKLPWGDPAFSERMLREHLSQSHDGASRRLEVVDRHVRWIHDTVLRGRPSRILDLGCGPGLYTERLAKLGHSCVGLDVAPAAIDYARARAADIDPAPRYVVADVTTADFAGRFDLVTIIHGELNTFSTPETEEILRKARSALDPGGHMLIEAHPASAVERLGRRPRTWMPAQSGLFGDRPTCDSTRATGTRRQVAR